MFPTQRFATNWQSLVSDEGLIIKVPSYHTIPFFDRITPRQAMEKFIKLWNEFGIGRFS
jgi:hypothetical protein